MRCGDSRFKALVMAGILVAALPSSVSAGDGEDSRSGSVTAGRAQAQTEAPSPDLPYKYVGNSFSLKFHRPSCVFARAMGADRVELFHFRRQAIEAGMKPCRYCLPPDWKTVKASVVGDRSKRE